MLHNSWGSLLPWSFVPSKTRWQLRKTFPFWQLLTVSEQQPAPVWRWEEKPRSSRSVELSRRGSAWFTKAEGMSVFEVEGPWTREEEIVCEFCKMNFTEMLVLRLVFWVRPSLLQKTCTSRVLLTGANSKMLFMLLFLKKKKCLCEVPKHIQELFFFSRYMLL